MKNAQTNTAQDSANKTLKANAGFDMSKSTSKALNNLAKSTNALSEAQADANKKPKSWVDKIPILGSILPTKHNRAQKKLATATADQQLSQKKANTAIAGDSKLKKSKENAGKENPLSKVLKPIVIILIVLVVLFLLMFILKKFRKKKPKKKPEKKPAEEPKEDSGKRDLSLLEVNYDKLLHENAKEVGVNADEVLQLYGGADNVRQASDVVQYCKAKGLKGEEAMAHITKSAEHFKDYGI